MIRHTQQPAINNGYILNPKRGFWSVEIPTETTNRVSNPSTEVDTTGWFSGVATLSQSDDVAYVGAYSLKATGAPGNVYASYTEYPVAAGQYTFSAALYSPTDCNIGFFVDVNGAGAGYSYVSLKANQWTPVVYTYPIVATLALNSVEIYFEMQSFDATFYVDAMQLEDGVYTTPYFDGSSVGCYWVGLIDRSPSKRTLAANAGRVINFDDFGLFIDQYSGAGMPNVDAQRSDYAIIDGASYEGTRVVDRVLALGGRFSGSTHQEVQMQRAALIDAINRDRSSLDVPCILRYQAHQCEDATGSMLQCYAVYIGGLEGAVDNLYNEPVIIQFRCDDPYFYEAIAATEVLTPNDAVSSYRIIRYDENHVWSNMGGGPDNGIVRAIVRGADGWLYVGGSFTSVMSKANTRYIARWREDIGWDNSIATFAAGVGGEPGVHSLAVAANGDLYVGGDFASVNAAANTKNIVKYTPTSTLSPGTWSSIMTTGADGTVRAMAVDGTGLLYFGGDFVSAGGVLAAYVAKYNGTSVSTVKPAASGANGAVYAIVIDTNNTVYVGGQFSQLDGVSASRIGSWNGSAWSALGTGMTTAANGGILGVRALAIAPSGLIYAGGNFVTAGGTTVNHVAAWTGTAWLALGTGITSTSTVPVRALAQYNNLLYVGGTYTGAGSIGWVYPGLGTWNGYIWLVGDLEFLAATTIYAIYAGRNGVTFGHDTFTSTTISKTTAVTTTATAATRPVFTIKNVLASAQRIYQILNVTSGNAVYFDLTMLVGETITIDLQRRRITSNLRGDVTYSVVAGSNFATWRLLPGRINYVNFYANGASNRAIMRINNAHWSVDGGVDR